MLYETINLGGNVGVWYALLARLMIWKAIDVFACSMVRCSCRMIFLEKIFREEGSDHTKFTILSYYNVTMET